MARALLIETSEAHAECLPAQVAALAQAGHTAEVLVHPALQPRLAGLGLEAEVLPLVGRGPRILRDLRTVGRILLRARAVDGPVVFNTLAGAIPRLTIPLLTGGGPVLAIEHDVGRLATSRSRRYLVRRLDGLLVLADRLVAPARAATGATVTAFPPAWFPPVPQVPKPAGEVWLAVVGAIDVERRDYGRLLAALSHGCPANLRIHLMGRPTGSAGHAMAEALRKIPGVVLHEGFLPEERVHGILAACDGLLPLVEGRERYVRHAVSGAFNLAQAHALPLVVGQHLDIGPEVDDRCVTPHQDEDLGALLHRLAATPRVLTAARDDLRRDPRWSFATLQEQYLAALGLSSRRTAASYRAPSWDGRQPQWA